MESHISVRLEVECSPEANPCAMRVYSPHKRGASLGSVESLGSGLVFGVQAVHARPQRSYGIYRGAAETRRRAYSPLLGSFNWYHDVGGRWTEMTDSDPSAYAVGWQP